MKYSAFFLLVFSSIGWAQTATRVNHYGIEEVFQDGKTVPTDAYVGNDGNPDVTCDLQKYEQLKPRAQEAEQALNRKQQELWGDESGSYMWDRIIEISQYPDCSSFKDQAFRSLCGMQQIWIERS